MPCIAVPAAGSETGPPLTAGSACLGMASRNASALLSDVKGCRKAQATCQRLLRRHHAVTTTCQLRAQGQLGDQNAAVRTSACLWGPGGASQRAGVRLPASDPQQGAKHRPFVRVMVVRLRSGRRVGGAAPGTTVLAVHFELGDVLRAAPAVLPPGPPCWGARAGPG